MLTCKAVQLYHGPNPFSAEPVLLCQVTCSDGNWRDYTYAADMLAKASLDWHSINEGSQSSENLRIGNFIADWCIQILTYSRGYLSAQGCMPSDTKENLLVWIGWHDAGLAKDAMRTAIYLLNLAENDNLNTDMVHKYASTLLKNCLRKHPDYQARIIMEAAQAKGIPFERAWGMPRYWRFGEGVNSRVLFESTSSDDGYLGGQTASSKAKTKIVLNSLGLPTPKFELVKNEEEASAAAQRIGFPCVTKPIDRGGGKGVSADLRTPAAVRRGFEIARSKSSAPILMEEHLEGDDHRIMISSGKFVAAIRRDPPIIVGDGKHTIKELVLTKNTDRRTLSLVKSHYLRPIQLDEGAQLHLSEMGLKPDSVLSNGHTIRVRSNGNLSTGGNCIDVSEAIHPEIRFYAETMARTLGVKLLGADYITKDISKSPKDVKGGFVEINLTPGLDALVAAGWSAERAGAVALDSKIDIVSKTLVVVTESQIGDLITSFLKMNWPEGIGWALRDRASIARANLTVPQLSGWPGVSLLLSHQSLTSAVIIASDVEIQRYGAPAKIFENVLISGNLPTFWRRILSARAHNTTDIEEGDFHHIIIRQINKIFGTVDNIK